MFTIGNHLLFQMNLSTSVTHQLAQLPLGLWDSILHCDSAPSKDQSCWLPLAQEGEKARMYTNAVISKAIL